MPESSSTSGTTVSTAGDTPGDSAPAESDMGVRDAQLAEGDGPDDATENGGAAPQPFSGGHAGETGPTAGPDERQV